MTLPVQKEKLMVWILCNSWEVTTVRFLRKWSLRRIHCCECRLVSYDWSVPLVLMYFSCTDAPTLLKSSPKKCLPESGICSPSCGPDFRHQAGGFKAVVQQRDWAKQMLQKPNHVMLYSAFKHTFGFQAALERFIMCFLSTARQIMSYCVIKAILLCRVCTCPVLKEHHLIPSSAVLTATRHCRVKSGWGFRCGNVTLVIWVVYFVQFSVHVTSLNRFTQWILHMLLCAPVLIPECVYHIVLTCLVTFITCSLF